MGNQGVTDGSTGCWPELSAITCPPSAGAALASLAGQPRRLSLRGSWCALGLTAFLSWSELGLVSRERVEHAGTDRGELHHCERTGPSLILLLVETHV